MEAKSQAKCDKKAFEKVLRISFHGGKRRAAVLFDSAALALLLFPALYLLALTRIKNPAAALAAASLIFIGAAAVRRAIMRERFISHKRRLMQSAREKARRYRMLLDPERLLSRIEPKEGESLHRSTDRLTSDDIVAAVRERGLPLTIITLAEPTNAAAELISLSNGQIKLVSPETRAGIKPDELYPVSDDEAKKTIVAMNGGYLKRFSLKKSLFALTRERALKYAAVGAGLYAFSFFVKYALYYRLIASLAMSIGAGVFAAEKLIKKD